MKHSPPSGFIVKMMAKNYWRLYYCRLLQLTEKEFGILLALAQIEYSK
ncbi:MAG: hypothetical protein Q8910_02410 [Bacteroidota bacterium]|nr:hypothetical protein [Bacteroidota bacterium]